MVNNIHTHCLVDAVPIASVILGQPALAGVDVADHVRLAICLRSLHSGTQSNLEQGTGPEYWMQENPTIPVTKLERNFARTCIPCIIICLFWLSLLATARPDRKEQGIEKQMLFQAESLT